jgi:hypothetical protein
MVDSKVGTCFSLGFFFGAAPAVGMPLFWGCIALSIIVTLLFNASGGSILLSAIFHFMLMNPIFPDAQPFDTYLLVLITGVMIWFNRKHLFNRETAVVEVIPSQTG